jgi:peptidase E
MLDLEERKKRGREDGIHFGLWSTYSIHRWRNGLLWIGNCLGKNCLCRLSEMEQMLDEGDLKALALPKIYPI